MPLAYLVTAANVSEVTVGLKVVDRVRVPRRHGRPKKRPASLGADKSYDSADFRYELNCDDGGFSLLFPNGNGPNAVAGRDVPQKLMRLASLAGRWRGVTVGWTTGVTW